MSFTNEECLEKIAIFVNFCTEGLDSLSIYKREFYYVWRYVLAELGVLIDKCNVSEKVKSACRDVDLNAVYTATHKILCAQYSSVTNEEVMHILSRLCICLKHALTSSVQFST
jgi:hypothetical protein